MYKGKARINRKYINLKTLQEKRREEMITHHSHPIIQKKKNTANPILSVPPPQRWVGFISPRST